MNKKFFSKETIIDGQVKFVNVKFEDQFIGVVYTKNGADFVELSGVFHGKQKLPIPLDGFLEALHSGRTLSINAYREKDRNAPDSSLEGLPPLKLYPDYSRSSLEKRIRYHEDPGLIITYPTSYDGPNGVLLDRFLVYFDSSNVANSVDGSLETGKVITATIHPPKSRPGVLTCVPIDKSEGVPNILENELDIYCNPETGWLCLGDPEAQGESVEFITNCIAVLSDSHNITSLWIRPDVLPKSLQQPLQGN